MIIRKLEVSSFRGVNSQALSFGPGLTLVAGPNESGKSTMCQALQAALFMPYNSSKQEARDLWSWHLAGQPRVQLEFVLGGETWKVDKTFAKRKDGATLHRDGRLVATDAKVQEVLEQALKDAGELDWLGLLWGTQGHVGVDLKTPHALQDRLQAAAGATVAPELESLSEAIEEEFARYWTPKTGKPKKAVQDVRDEELQAESELQSAELELEQADERAQSVLDLQQRVAELDRAMIASERELALARQAFEAWNQFRVSHDRLANQRARLKLLEQWLERMYELEQQLAELAPLAAPDRARQKELQLKLALPPARDAIDRAQAEKRLLELLEQQSVRRELAELAAPTLEQLQKLRAQQRSAEKLSGAGLQATLQALTALNLDLRVDGKALDLVALGAGQEATWAATELFELELPGIARLQLRQNPMQERVAAERVLAEQLTRLGLSSLDEAEQRHARAALLQARMAPFSEAELERLRTKLAPAALEMLDSEQRLELLAQSSERLAQLEASWSQSQASFQTDQVEFQRMLRDNRPAREDALRDQLRNLQAAGPGLEPCEDWAQELAQGKDSLAALELDCRRPEGTEITPALLEQLQRRLESERGQAQDARGQLQREVGRMQEQGELYVRKQVASERLARVRERVEALDRQAYAARLLRDALAEARTDLEKTHVSPLGLRVSERLAELTAGRYRGVQLDRSWGIQDVLPEGVERAGVGALSFGTQEQLAFLCRLCLAELLGQNQERHLVIFDDNLVHTDAGRMAQACGWLEAAAERVQIVVFTCHPERYSDLKTTPLVLQR